MVSYELSLACGNRQITRFSAIANDSHVYRMLWLRLGRLSSGGSLDVAETRSGLAHQQVIATLAHLCIFAMTNTPLG